MLIEEKRMILFRKRNNISNSNRIFPVSFCSCKYINKCWKSIKFYKSYVGSLKYCSKVNEVILKTDIFDKIYYVIDECHILTNNSLHQYDDIYLLLDFDRFTMFLVTIFYSDKDFCDIVRI